MFFQKKKLCSSRLFVTKYIHIKRISLNSMINSSNLYHVPCVTFDVE